MTRYWFEDVLQLRDDWEHSAFSSVNAWIKAIRRRGNSRDTKRNYFRFLGYFCRFARRTPNELLALTKDDAETLIQEFCDTYAAKGQLRTAHTFVGYARSFYKHNKYGALSLEDYKWKSSRQPERVPTKQEAYQMASAAKSLRDKGLILCAFQSGLRNSTMRSLQYGDVRDQVESEQRPIVIHVSSALKIRVPGAAKEDVDHYTFFGPEACHALTLYLRHRREREGPIHDHEPLFNQEGGYRNKTDRFRHLNETVLQRLVKKAAKRAGIDEWRHVKFHSLRKTFRSVLDAGYLEGGQMAEDDKEYLMGHTLPSQKAPYHNANIKVLAQRYMRLNWSPAPSVTREQVRSEFIRIMMGRVNDTEMSSLARQLGITPIQIRQMIQRFGGAQSQVEAETEVLLNTERHREDTNNYRTKLISEDAVCSHLDDGWTLIKELASGNIVVQKPKPKKPN